MVNESATTVLFDKGSLALYAERWATACSTVKPGKAQKLVQVRDFGVPKSYHNTMERSSLGNAFSNVFIAPLHRSVQVREIPTGKV